MAHLVLLSHVPAFVNDVAELKGLTLSKHGLIVQRAEAIKIQ